MRLDQVLQKANSVSDLYDIFADKQIQVKIHCLSDSVSVEGYEGTVSTDQIARKTMLMPYSEPDIAENFAEILRTRIFFPLKDALEDPENKCGLYHLIAYKRIGYTPPPATPGLNTHVALKHAMCIELLLNKL